MTDERDLLAAILAQPDDDNVRLVYADWLQENGQDLRAELIRVQCELVSEPVACTAAGKCLHGPNAPRYDKGDPVYYCGKPACVKQGALRRRAFQILVESSKQNLRWTSDALTYWLRTEPRYPPRDVENRLIGLFVRGMIEHVTGPAAEWLQHADAILREHPVRKVTLTTMPPLDNCGGASHKGWLEYSSEKWPGVEFELPLRMTVTGDWKSAEAALQVSADGVNWVNVPVSGTLTVNPPSEHEASGTNYASAVTSQSAFNRMIGGIIENLVVQDGLLPEGDEEEDDEEEDDEDIE